MATIKRGLVIEGGGIRGSHSAGALAELHENKDVPSFDVICGSSAGACSIAYWVSQQHHILEKLWSNYLHGGRFIRYRHLLTPRPIMNLDYLIHDVFVHREPLDTQAIIDSPVDFYITATNCHTGKAHYFHNKDRIDVLEALRASAAMPIAYPLPVWNRGEPYADGGIADSIPIQKALDENCDEIWLVLTQPAGYRKEAVSRWPWPRWIFRRYPALAEAILERHIRYNRQLDFIDELERQGRARVIRPSAELPVSRLTRKHSLILETIAMGRKDAAAFLANSLTPSRP